jgi:hypothetical protein
MPILDAFGEGYLRLTLEINKHIDGYVDSYYGPPEIKAEVESGEKKPIAALKDDFGRLHGQIPRGDAERAAYLEGLLRAVGCTIRIAGGETLDYMEEVRLIYDVTPAAVDESVFTTAHNELDTLLPGSGDLSERLDAWRKPYELSIDKLNTALNLTREETRRRTVALLELVSGESIQVSLTKDQPWSAYNWFKGNAHSLIEFNTDIPVSALDIANLFAHEGYPGHHTEHQLKEQHLYNEQGWAECASALLHSPSAVIAEGIATTAAEIIFPEGVHRWTADVLIPRLGLPQLAAGQLRRIGAARESLRGVSPNAAMAYHGGKLDEEQTVSYIRTYALSTEQRARQSFRFIANPLYRSYPFTYTEGYRLIETASKGGDKKRLFMRLLTEEVLPSRWGG